MEASLVLLTLVCSATFLSISSQGCDLKSEVNFIAAFVEKFNYDSIRIESSGAAAADDSFLDSTFDVVQVLTALNVQHSFAPQQIHGMTLVFDTSNASRGIDWKSNDTLLMSETLFNKIDFPSDFLRLNSEVYVYECRDSVITLDEVYAISGHGIVRQEIGRFEDEEEATLDVSEFIWERRSDLKGVTLTNVVLDFGRFAEMQRTENGTIDGGKGLSVEIVQQLSEELNFSIKFVDSYDGNWGAKDPESGRWNGMIRMLMEDEADICTTALSITPERNEVIEYSLPIERDIDTLMIRAPRGTAMNFWAYVDIFMLVSWIGVALTTLALAAAFVCLQFLGKENFHSRSDSENFKFFHALALVVLVTIQREYPLASSALRLISIRILLFTACCSGFLLFAFYSGVLTSLMTSKAPPVAVRAFGDVLNLNLKVLVWRSTDNEGALKTAAENTAMADIYAKMKGDASFLVNSVEEAKERMMKNGDVLYFGSSATFAKDPDIIVLNLPDALYGYFAFGFRKNSQYSALFNYHLFKLEERGFLAKLRERWTSPKSKASTTSTEAAALGYDNVLFPFLILAFGLILGLLFGISEKWSVTLLPAAGLN